jgi:hypothetical protein
VIRNMPKGKQEREGNNRKVKKKQKERRSKE